MHSHPKIMELEALAERLVPLRQEGKRIVLCHGVFDLLHIGHIRHLREAKAFGDVLVVTLTPDVYVDKGAGRPAFTEILRAESIASLDAVDFVAVNQWPTAEETLRLLRPDIYAKGSEFQAPQSDYTGKIDREAEIVSEIGAEMRFTEEIVFSSSNLINRFFSAMPAEIKEYLGLFRSRHSIEKIHDVLDRMASLKVLVIGDAILEDYSYCDPIGQSNTDPALAMLLKSGEMFAEGALAVANHVAEFADDVTLVTGLGEGDCHERFIRDALRPNVQSRFVMQPGVPTLTRRHFLDRVSLSKLMEIYNRDAVELPEDRCEELCEWLRGNSERYDLVVVADFGLGMMNEPLINALKDRTPFLTVMTQSSAGSRGAQSIGRYTRANFVCLTEKDVRLKTAKSAGELRPIVDELAAEIRCEKFVATRGRMGALVRGSDGSFIASPALAAQVVDRSGARNAFFSITALAAALGADDEILGFLGNVIGSLAVGTIGQEHSIGRLSVKKSITALMK